MATSATDSATRDAPMVRAVVVDDEPTAREVVMTLLAEYPTVQVVGEASNGKEAVQLVRRLRPDLVICSRVTFTIKQAVANWVELYPEFKPYSTFYINGQHRAKREVELSDLLALCASPP